MREVSCRPVRSDEEMLTGAPRCNRILTFRSLSMPETGRGEVLAEDRERNGVGRPVCCLLLGASCERLWPERTPGCLDSQELAAADGRQHSDPAGGTQRDVGARPRGS